MSWPYSNNPFKSHHNSSFVKFVVIMHFTLNALKTAKDDDPEYLAMYNILLPIADDYDALYALWLAARGPSEGSVEAFAAILREESAQVHLWDMGVQQHYLNTTIEWAKMFPDKLSGFYTPTTEEGKVLEVQAFVERTKVYPLVDTVMDMAVVFHKKLDDGLKLKDADLKALYKASTNLKKNQDFVADELFGLLGKCMYFHRNEPLKTDGFFDLEEMHTKQSTGEIKLKVNEFQYYIGAHKLITLPLNHTKKSVIKVRAYLGTSFKLFSDSVITPTVDKIPNTTCNIGEKEINEFKMGQLGAENNAYIMLYNDSDEEGMLVFTMK